MLSALRHILSRLYGAYMVRRNTAFDNGKGVMHAEVPVISIGNVSTGGTGKSPLVIEVCRLLLDLGHAPAVVSRGYGRSSRGVLVVSDASSVLASVADAGDELSMIARALPSCVIVAAEQRFLGIARAVRLYDIDVAVIDDGFQHRQCARSCDIVIVDRATLDHPRVIPEGLLREPLSALSRASLVCCTADVREDEVRPFTSAPVVHLHTVIERWLRHDAQGAHELTSGTESPFGPDVRPTMLVCAIAHPERVRRTCEQAKVPIVVEHCFRDHHVYTARDVQSIIRMAHEHACTAVVTTQKDMVKLESFLPVFAEAHIDIFTPRIRSVCDQPEVLRSVITAALHAPRAT